MTFIQWMSLNFYKTEKPLLGGQKEKLKEVHFSQDGAIHLWSMKTKFTSLVEDSVMT